MINILTSTKQNINDLFTFKACVFLIFKFLYSERTNRLITTSVPNRFVFQREKSPPDCFQYDPRKFGPIYHAQRRKIWPAVSDPLENNLFNISRLFFKSLNQFSLFTVERSPPFHVQHDKGREKGAPEFIKLHAKIYKATR